MSKKIIGMLLVICMIIGLLPVVAMAATPKTEKIRILSWTTVTLTEGGAPVYYKNSAYDLYDKDGNLQTAKGYKQVKGDENDWNVKFEFPTGGVVTVTLKDAKIANAINGKAGYTPSTNADTGAVEYKSTGSVGAFIPNSGNNIDVKFILEGDNFVDCSYGLIRGTVGGNQYFKSLTIEGKNGGKLYGWGGAQTITAKGNISFINANVEVFNTGKGGTCVPIYNDSGNITIEGGHIKASNTQNVAIQAKAGNIIVNGNVTTNHSLTSTADAAGLDAPEGEIIINGGNLNLTSTNAPGLRAPTITINGGNIKIETPYRGVWAKGEGGCIIILGGSIEIVSQRAFNIAPTLGADVSGMAGLAADDEDNELYEAEMYVKPYVKLEKGFTPPTTQPTTKPTTQPTTQPTTKPTTQPTTKPTTQPTTKPATQPTESSTAPIQGDEAPAGGNDAVIAIAIVAVALVVAVAIVVIAKKKRAAA